MQRIFPSLSEVGIIEVSRKPAVFALAIVDFDQGNILQNGLPSFYRGSRSVSTAGFGLFGVLVATGNPSHKKGGPKSSLSHR